MKDYNVKFLDSLGNIGGNSRIYQLENSATVLDLKKAVEDKIVVYKSDQFRLFFRQENGQNLGLDEDEVLEDVVNDSGQILVQCPTLGILKGKVWIHKDFNEEVFILLGSTKSFDHLKVYRTEGSNMDLPLGKID